MVLPRCGLGRPKTANQWGFRAGKVLLEIKTEFSIREVLNIL